MAVPTKPRSLIRDHWRYFVAPIIIAALIVVGLFILNPPNATPFIYTVF
jgi:hypothetical protein